MPDAIHAWLWHGEQTNGRWQSTPRSFSAPYLAIGCETLRAVSEALRDCAAILQAQHIEARHYVIEGRAVTVSEVLDAADAALARPTTGDSNDRT